eukprot:4761883-Amphidinium_carterae.2
MVLYELLEPDILEDEEEEPTAEAHELAPASAQAVPNPPAPMTQAQRLLSLRLISGRPSGCSPGICPCGVELWLLLPFFLPSTPAALAKTRDAAWLTIKGKKLSA